MMMMKEEFVSLVNNNDYSDVRVFDIFGIMMYLRDLDYERELLFCSDKEFKLRMGYDKSEWFIGKGVNISDEIKSFVKNFMEFIDNGDEYFGRLQFWYELYGGEQMLKRIFNY